jgi:hypothetical protein
MMSAWLLPDAVPPKVDVFALYSRTSRGVPAVRAVLDHVIQGLGRAEKG